MDADEYSINDRSDVIALLELHQLYQGDVFAYYCKERRETLLISLHFLPHKSQLCLRILDPDHKGSTAGGFSDLWNSDNTPSDRNFANGGLMVLDLPCLMVSAAYSQILFISFMNRW